MERNCVLHEPLGALRSAMGKKRRPAGAAPWASPRRKCVCPSPGAGCVVGAGVRQFEGIRQRTSESFYKRGKRTGWWSDSWRICADRTRNLANQVMPRIVKRRHSGTKASKIFGWTPNAQPSFNSFIKQLLTSAQNSNRRRGESSWRVANCVLQ